MIKLTPVAAEEIRKVMEPHEYLRVSVSPGGCSGFKYDFVIAQKKEEDDNLIEHDDIQVLIDPFSSMYLTGTEIDFKKSLTESGFTFSNPNSTGGCGCGKSFNA